MFLLYGRILEVVALDLRQDALILANIPFLLMLAQTSLRLSIEEEGALALGKLGSGLQTTV